MFYFCDMSQKKSFTANVTRMGYRSILRKITKKLERSSESWEVDDELQTLWSMGDNGDLVAFTLYGLALLMEGRGWYDPEEGKLALENAAEAGCSMAQFYLGRFFLEEREDHPADLVNGKFWMLKAAEQGCPEAKAFVKKRWGLGQMPLPVRITAV